MAPIGSEPIAIVERTPGVNLNSILNPSDDTPASNVLMDGSVKCPRHTHVALEITGAKTALQHFSALAITIIEEVKYDGQRFSFLETTIIIVIEFHQSAN